MGFKQLFQRALLVLFAPWSWFVSIFFGLYFGISFNVANAIGLIIMVLMFYKAIIPWGRDRITVGDVVDQWKNLFK